MQNALSNVVGSVTLLTTHPFHVGDFVEIGSDSGTVEEISVSYTKLATVDGKRIYIPNSDAASARICNYSVEGRRRVDLYIGVSYDAPAEKVREALLAAAQHPKALQDPAPLVVLNNYQDSSIQYLLMLWTASGDYLDVRFAVNEAVKRELDARGIAIPYPQLDVHFEPQKRNTWRLWFKVVLAVIPSAVIGLPLDDWMDAHFYNYVVVAITLIVYGIAFLFVERENSNRRAYANSVYDIDLKTALLIGCFQCLSLIPGTSRSGSTILGAIILGVGRAAGAEFSFFLAIPTMLGASVLKLVKFLLSGVSATGAEWAILAVGCVVSFVVSLLVIKGLMEYVRKHSFAVFGVYRIILGVLVLGYFAFQTLHA